MIKHILFLCIFVVSQNKIYAQTNSPSKNVLILNQTEVVNRVMKYSDQATQIQLQYQQNKLAPALLLFNYDWKLNAETGFQYDKSASFSPSVVLGSKYERTKANLTLQKALSTGTLFGLEYNHLEQKYSWPSTYTSTVSSGLAQDNVGVSIEQALWGNSFGLADRALIDSANLALKSQEISQSISLQDLALSAIKMYWDAYVSSQQAKEALASRERTKKLLDSVQKKTNLGYSNPGDLPQTLALYETQEQKVRQAQADFESKVDQLKTLLKIDPSVSLEFQVQESLPAWTDLGAIEVEKLRLLQSQKLKMQSAENAMVAAQSSSHPKLSLVGKAYSTGSDLTAEDSQNMMTSGGHPNYYLGLKLSYSFGSDYYQADIQNKLATKELERSKYLLSKDQIKDQIKQSERKVKTNYEVALSLQKQKKFYDQALVELNKTYQQGRTDIKNLIDTMNNFFSTELLYERALGDYQVSLSEYLALKDELYKN